MMGHYPFGETVEIDIMTHAVEVWPNESVGYINKSGSYVKLKNLHEDPTEHFRVSKNNSLKIMKEAVCVIHSHPDGPAVPSYNDMAQQIEMGIPWGIVVSYEHRCGEIFYWGGLENRYPLVGRPFKNGVFDCYSLVKDYCWETYNLDFGDVPREDLWWKTDHNVIMENISDLGFVDTGISDITDLEPGHLLIGALTKGEPNHCGVYVGEDKFLHHLAGRLSRHDYIQPWWSYIHKVMRYEGG